MMASSSNLQGGSVLPNIADLIKADPPHFGSDAEPPFESVLAYATRLLGPMLRARVLPLAAEEAGLRIVMEPHQSPEMESLVPLAQEIGNSLAGETRLVLARRMIEGRLHPDLRMFLALCLLLRLHPKLVPIKGETPMPADLPTEPSVEPEADQATPAAELEQAGGTDIEQPVQPVASEEVAGRAVVETASESVDGGATAAAAPSQGFFAFAVEARERADESLAIARDAVSSVSEVLEAGGDTAAVWPVLQEAEAKVDTAKQMIEKIKAAVKRVDDEAAEKEAKRVAELERQRQREEARLAAQEAKAAAAAAKAAAKEAEAIAKEAARDAKLKAQDAAEKLRTAREAQLKLAQTSTREPRSIAKPKPKPAPKPKPVSIEEFSRLASVPDKIVMRLVRDGRLATTATKPKVLIDRKAAEEFTQQYVSREEIRKGAHGEELEVVLNAGRVPPVLSFPRGVDFYERSYVKSLLDALS